MEAVTQGELTTNTLIDIRWVEPDNSYSPIISYTIKYKFVDDADYQELVSNYNQL
jgi:hypothetical protein